MKKFLLLFAVGLFSVFSVQAQGITGKWKLSSMKISGEKTEITSSGTLNISDKNEIGGNGGCNNYGGSFSLEESNSIKFGSLFSTKMYCSKSSKIEIDFSAV